VRPVGIGPAVAHLTGLGRPEVHTPRQSDGRIGIARRKREIRLRAYQCRNIVRRTLRGSLPGRRARTAGQNGGAKGREKDISTFHCCHFRLKFVPYGRLRSHFEFERAARGDLFETDIGLGVRLAVEFHALNVFVSRVKKSLLSIKFIFWRVALFRLTRDRSACSKLIKSSLEKLRSALNKLTYGAITL